MRKVLVFLLLVLGFKLCALDITDRNAINQAVQHFTHAWNHNHGKGSADFYAEDADFVNIFGDLFSGKEEIEKRHVKIHETFLRDSIFKVTDTKLRQVTPDFVIAQVYWHVQNPKWDQKDMKGIFTHAFVKKEGRWEITSTQNTLIPNTKPL